MYAAQVSNLLFSSGRLLRFARNDIDEIIRHLLVNHSLPPDAAEFAADQILLAAARLNGEAYRKSQWGGGLTDRVERMARSLSNAESKALSYPRIAA